MSTFARSDNEVFAVETGDRITIKQQKGEATCTTSLGISCSTAKFQNQISLTVTEPKEPV